MKKAIIIAVLSTMVSSSAFANTQPQPEPTGGQITASVFSNVFYIPGKTGTCVLSAAIWIAGMTVSAGVLHKEMGDMVNGACGGKWVLKGEDFMDRTEKK